MRAGNPTARGRFLMVAGVWLLVLQAPLVGDDAKDSKEVPGTRAELSLGQLFVPQDYRAVSGKVPLTLHLHGAPAVVEREFARSKADGVLVTVSLSGLSGVYKAKFEREGALDGILKKTAQKLAELKVAEKPEVSRLTVSSFSAGFGGVRELLKEDRAFDRIDTLVMADSLYCGYAEGSTPPRVDPKLMEGFLRFAKEAKEGRKTLVLSHCDLQPETYASTRETADYLLAQIGLKRTAVDEEWARSWRCTSRCRSKGIHVLGFSGEQGSDHMRHLMNIALLYEEATKKE